MVIHQIARPVIILFGEKERRFLPSGILGLDCMKWCFLSQTVTKFEQRMTELMLRVLTRSQCNIMSTRIDDKT